MINVIEDELRALETKQAAEVFKILKEFKDRAEKAEAELALYMENHAVLTTALEKAEVERRELLTRDDPTFTYSFQVRAREAEEKAALHASDAKIAWGQCEGLRSELAAMTEDYLRRHKDAVDRYEEIVGLKAELAQARKALTPSAETKAAYMGEFQFTFPDYDENHEEITRRINVPWITIKAIMAAISVRALKGEPK